MGVTSEPIGAAGSDGQRRLGTGRPGRLFGLRVATPLDLSLPDDPGRADVAIGAGPVVPHGEHLWHSPPPGAFDCFRAGTTTFLVWPGARFAVAGDRVLVDAPEPAAALDAYLQPVWSVVLAARGREALHGCAVARDGTAVAVLGTSGAGKTTAGLALVDRGWALVADDLLVFDPAGRLVPGPPLLRLTPDRAAGRDGRADAAGKLRHPVPACPAPVAPRALVVLGDRYPAPVRLAGAAAVDALLTQAYNPVLTHPGQAARRFALAADLADRVPVHGAPPRSLSAGSLERWAAGEAPGT